MSEDKQDPEADDRCYSGSDQMRLDRMERKLDQLHLAMIGKPEIGFRGVVPRLDMVEITIAQIAAERAAEKSTRKGAMLTVTAIGTFAGSVGAAAAWLLQQITTRQ
jgi:hypothetical protein